MDTMTHDVVEPRRASMTRPRRVTLLACALACLAVVAVFGLMVTQDRSPLDDFDRWGRQAEGWADNHAALVTALRAVEVSFATFGMIIWTTLVVVAVASRRRYRAAAFAIAVMVDCVARDHWHQAVARPRPPRVAGQRGPAHLEVLPVRSRVLERGAGRNPDLLGVELLREAVGRAGWSPRWP